MHLDPALLLLAAFINYVTPLKAGMAPLLVKMIQSAHTEAELTPALRALGNIVTGESDQTQAVLAWCSFFDMDLAPR
jgi:hypothetical protein